jgi:hypothetical protein
MKKKQNKTIELLKKVLKSIERLEEKLGYITIGYESQKQDKKQ